MEHLANGPGMTEMLEVAAGLVFRGGRLLIAQRRDEDHQGGLWEFPGGKRRTEESFEECLRRELLEELGVDVEVGAVLEEVVYAYPDRTVLLRFFLCRWRQHEPQALGCQDFAWITREELQGYTFPPADQKLLEQLDARRELWGVG